ncbi:MAG: hypothetical protein HYZ71_13985 [Deltaproteobacteria bacterium]|nr:hypothetical protein [Deltaproteobacteria bacterium]
MLYQVTILFLLVLSAPLFAEGGDFESDESAILITSARLHEVDHGWIEAYYPKAVFYHHKLQTAPQGQDNPVGFLSLDEARPEVNRVTGSFSGESGSYIYTIGSAHLFPMLNNLIPQNYQVCVKGEWDCELTVATGFKQGEKAQAWTIIPAFKNPNLGKEQKEGDPVDPNGERVMIFPRATHAFLLEVGPRSGKVPRRYAEFREGIDGNPESGEKLYRSLYDIASLTIEISRSQIAGPMFEPKVVTWYVVAGAKLPA